MCMLLLILLLPTPLSSRISCSFSYSTFYFSCFLLLYLLCLLLFLSSSYFSSCCFICLLFFLGLCLLFPSFLYLLLLLSFSSSTFCPFHTQFSSPYTHFSFPSAKHPWQRWLTWMLRVASSVNSTTPSWKTPSTSLTEATQSSGLQPITQVGSTCHALRKPLSPHVFLQETINLTLYLLSFLLFLNNF